MLLKRFTAHVQHWDAGFFVHALRAGRPESITFRPWTMLAVWAYLCAVTPVDDAFAVRFWLSAFSLEYGDISDKNQRYKWHHLHASTVRRLLNSAGIVWQRAAPTLRIRDPHKEDKMPAIAKALNACNVEHPVFYKDEVDIHLNLKIGADWQRRGHQNGVVTPWKNEKILSRRCVVQWYWKSQ